jgi:hypothetical protein
MDSGRPMPWRAGEVGVLVGLDHFQIGVGEGFQGLDDNSIIRTDPDRCPLCQEAATTPGGPHTAALRRPAKVAATFSLPSLASMVRWIFERWRA